MEIHLSPWPTQPAAKVAGAAAEVPDALDRLGKRECSAKALATALQGRGHGAFTADQAIRLLISRGLLTFSPRPSYLPTVFDQDGNVTFKGGRIDGVLPPKGVIGLELIEVQADDSLWVRQLEVSSAPQVSVNARMLDVISKNLDSRGWSVRQWASHLGCAVSTVHKQPAWKSLRVMNAGDKLAKAKPKDRSRHGGRTIHDKK